MAKTENILCKEKYLNQIHMLNLICIYGASVNHMMHSEIIERWISAEDTDALNRNKFPVLLKIEV